MMELTRARDFAAGKCANYIRFESACQFSNRQSRPDSKECGLQPASARHRRAYRNSQAYGFITL